MSTSATRRTKTPQTARGALRQAIRDEVLHLHLQIGVGGRQTYTRLVVARRASGLCGTDQCWKVNLWQKME